MRLPVFAPEVIIAAQGHALLIFANAADRGEAVILAEAGAPRAAHQMEQGALLCCCRVLTFKRPEAMAGIEPEQWGCINHYRI